jgi:urease accessory protein
MHAPGTLLRLMWLASPALPVGGFSYSEGLEAAVDGGLVHDEASAGDWLLDQLLLGQARSDLPLLAQAFDAWTAHDTERIAALAAWWSDTRETQELRLQTEQTARSLLQWLRQGAHAGDERIPQLAALPPGWPMAFALATVLAGATRADALLAAAWSWAENQVAAAIKAVPLGQAAAQRMLQRLADAIPSAVDIAGTLPDEQRQSFLPGLTLLSARHETQYSRLFRS